MACKSQHIKSKLELRQIYKSANYLLQPHDEEGGEDDVGEEGDEVNHFPVGLEEKEKYYINGISSIAQMEPLKLVMKVTNVLIVSPASL